ncbi:transposase [Mycobacteroides abscessus]
MKFFELLAQGYGVKESARIIGVNYRTVKRWRSGDTRCGHTKRAGRPTQPCVRTYRLISSRYLSVQDRIAIADALLAGESIRSIAAGLGRSPSTISREIRRNAHPDSGAYRPYAAQDRAEARLPRPKRGKIARSAELRSFIQRHLMLRWSPEQIARTLRLQFPDRPEMHVTHETTQLGHPSPTPRYSHHRSRLTGTATDLFTKGPATVVTKGIVGQTNSTGTISVRAIARSRSAASAVLRVSDM